MLGFKGEDLKMGKMGWNRIIILTVKFLPVFFFFCYNIIIDQASVKLMQLIAISRYLLFIYFF